MLLFSAAKSRRGRDYGNNNTFGWTSVLKPRQILLLWKWVFIARTMDWSLGWCNLRLYVERTWLERNGSGRMKSKKGPRVYSSWLNNGIMKDPEPKKRRGCLIERIKPHIGRYCRLALVNLISMLKRWKRDIWSIFRRGHFCIGRWFICKFFFLFYFIFLFYSCLTSIYNRMVMTDFLFVSRMQWISLSFLK